MKTLEKSGYYNVTAYSLWDRSLRSEHIGQFLSGVYLQKNAESAAINQNGTTTVIASKFALLVRPRFAAGEFIGARFKHASVASAKADPKGRSGSGVGRLNKRASRSD